MWRLTDEQRALREEIREIVRAEIRPRVRTMEENCEYPRDLYEVMASHRLLGLGFPEEFGGRCNSEASWCAYVEELAKVSGTVSLMAAYVKLVSLPLLLAGAREQQERGIPRLAAGGDARAAGAGDPAAADGRDPRLLRVERAERRLRPRRARDAGGSSRRWVGAQRRQEVHRQRGLERRLHRLRAHGQRRSAGRERVPGRRPRAGRLGREAADHGDAGLAARRAALRGRRGAGREPDRPRGRRLQDRDGDLRPLPADGRGPGRRARAGRD